MSCRNSLNNLDLCALFGQDPVSLHPCFTTWAVSQNIAKLERQPLFDLILEKAFLMEEFHDYVSEPYLEWRAKWDRVPVSERDSGTGLFLKQELLRLGLTSREGQLVFYSFCRRDGWQETEHSWHCRICSDCMEWREWHCERCNQCSYGLSLPCENCGREKHRYGQPELNELSDDDSIYQW